VKTSTTVRVLALFLLFQGVPLLAKELYVTVRRDFGPTEAPELELHYAREAPFDVRIYRPKDMKEFVTSQVDLRRAWREPAVEWNSAKYLFSGLNKTRFGLDWLRSAANLPLRKRLMEDFGGGSTTPGGTRLSEGPAKIVAGPSNFTLVNEVSFQPDGADARAPFDVPGFDWWFSREGGLRQKIVRLPKLSPGFYLVQIVQGDLEGQVVLAVNDLSASVQQTDGAALVRVSRRDGRPAPGIEVEVRNLRGQWTASGKSDADGVVFFEDLKDSELLVVVREGDSTAIVDTEFFPTTAVFPDLYLYTDRPLYKSGATVRFKGVLRQPQDGLSRLWSSLTGRTEVARVAIVDLAGKVIVQEVDAPLSAYGTFSGALTIARTEGEGDLNGVYRVRATIAGASHAGEFRVREYVKPLFLFKVKTDQETLQAGGSLTASVNVERYAGGVPEGVKVSAQLFRVRAETPQWVEDAGLGEAGSATTYGWDGKSESGSVSVPFPVANVDDMELDAQGHANLALKLPETLPGPPNYDYSFVLRLYGRDPDGNSASFSKTFLDVRSEVVALARMSSVYASAERPARLSIRAVHPSGRPYGKTPGSVAWTLTPYKLPPVARETTFTTGDDGRFDVPVPVDTAGRLDAVVTLRDRFDKPTTGEASIIVAPREPGAPVADVSEVTILQEREVFTPGETARALVLLPEGWGDRGGNRGRLHLTVAGRRIFARHVQAVDGLSTWVSVPLLPDYGTAAYAILAYADPARGWIERTLTFRIPPKDKALAVAVKPQAAFVKPGQRQAVSLRVVDAAGKPVEAEVSISVVDKALLALQPEFRPSLLSFFYPTERLNVMSFFSREFQSYGYGERLARLFRPNFWMAATKPDRKDRKEDDTAYWNARVLTDADGRASVSFVLPANQTTWNVSAVAVDTRGRFGEGSGEFGTNAKVTFSVAVPAFLRVGDSAQVRLLVSNQDTIAREVKATLVAPAGVTSAGLPSVSATLAPRAEASGRGRVTLAATNPTGAVTLKTTLVSGKDTQRFESSVRTLPATVTFTETREVKPGEPVTGPFAAGEKLTGLRIFATNGFTATFLPALRWLMAYPYGCAEQVTSATVPSLLAKQLLDSKHRTLSPEQEDMRKSALEFSAAGLARLKTLQNLDGSFVWWSGTGKGDVSMTAVVLILVSSLDDPEAAKALDTPRSLGWLKAQVPDRGSSLGVAITYIESRLVVLGVAPEPGGTVEATLRFQADWVKANGTVLDKSLLLLSLRGLGFDSKPGLDRTAKDLVEDVSVAVGTLLGGAPPDPKRWTPLLGDWPGYPGRLPSTLAVAARALHTYDRLDLVATRKLSAWLLASFDGRFFGSTFETSGVLVHSAWLFESSLNAGRAMARPRVTAGGREIESGSLSGHETPGGYEIAVDPSEAARGRIEVTGVGEDVVLRARLTREVPLDAAPEVPGGWDLRKEYFRLDAKTGALSGLDGPVRVGDLVYVKLTFQPRRGRLRWWSSSYYVLRDEIPAGLSVVEEDKVYDAAPFRLSLHAAGSTTRDVRSDRILWTFAFERAWMDRTFQTGYVLRAQYAGDFATGVARLEDFYDESLYSQTASRRVAVDPLPDRPRK
jgi:alpha-2-macroglobulin